MVCEVCKFSWHVPGFYPIFTDTGVTAFYYEHGLDLVALHDAAAFDRLNDPLEAVTVTAEDPVELRVTVELEGDRLAVTLDADANVSKVSVSKK